MLFFATGLHIWALNKAVKNVQYIPSIKTLKMLTSTFQNSFIQKSMMNYLPII
jgi:hypothetical protein